MLLLWMKSLQDFNIVSILLLLIILVSLFQGWRKGASHSAGRLLSLLRDGVFVLLSYLYRFHLRYGFLHGYRSG
ncbi:hypothetical protein JCM16418_2049 [Paenibacillus pini JCM 16418]|uniref:Uncharacterized protein n=1 Tax=Paenibacillus pini JCM 16418 TaxID=1236976 RepID=W7YJZ6_9BACL|nr:hypothetical protein JCM16418_2049 [Paenibacillus pini JCM 16418]